MGLDQWMLVTLTAGVGMMGRLSGIYTFWCSHEVFMDDTYWLYCFNGSFVCIKRDLFLYIV